MAIMDARLEFCDATSLAGAVATTVRGNIIDMGVANKDYGDGTPVYLHVRIGTVVAAAATSTLAFFLQESASTTAGSFANKLTLKAAANVGSDTTNYYAAGYKVYDGALPSVSYKRYLRIATTIATTPIASGTVDAFLSLDPTD
jgi:hypothetical protein